MKRLLKFSCLVLGLAVISAPIQVFALPQLEVNCNSEDDGSVTGSLVSTNPSGIVFDGPIGIMRKNRYIEIQAHAENFVSVGTNGVYALMQLCAIDTAYNVPRTCAKTYNLFFDTNQSAHMTLFALGGMDPEGINCAIKFTP